MSFNKGKLLITCSILILILLSAMSSAPPPEISISTPSYPIGVNSKESREIPYTFKASGNFSGVITTRMLQFYTQYDEPLSDLLGPYPTRINLNSRQRSEWNDLVYLPENVVENARAQDEYAIVLKTTFLGNTASGAEFHAQASVLLLLPPGSFSKKAPANRAANQPFNTSLQWNSSVGAIDYEYCFDTINNNSCDTGWIGSYEVQAKLRGLAPGTTFYWQVRANNTGGSTYANNNKWWSFTTCSSSSILVTNIKDSGAGSLRQAMAEICPGGTIKFAASLSGKTITLASNLPTIHTTMTIDGDKQSITINGAGRYRIFTVMNTGKLTINHLTLQNGKHSVTCTENNCGGGIYSDGLLTINNTTFSGNSATNGGAIYIRSGTVTVANSTFVGNSATNVGGAILNWIGILNVTNSTFHGNSAPQGGAIYNDVSVLKMTNSTLSGNSATHGGGLYNAGNMDLLNNILANSTSGEDCYNEDGAGQVLMNVNNLIENNAAPPNGCGIPMLTGDPKLGPLARNGGPTKTMALLSGSPAINAGDDASCPSLDQRGVSRPQGSGCDLGAYEAPIMTLLKSASAQDGWVLETNESSNQGDRLNAGAATFNLGDTANRRQYRAILSFNTSSLPDNAVITRVVVKIKKHSLAGTNPFTTHQKIAVDIRKGTFSNSGALQSTDFQALAHKPAVGLIVNNPTASGWYSARLNPAAYPYIHLRGITQFRLRFQLDDDNDAIADILQFYSGNATAANQPILVIEYYVP